MAKLILLNYSPDVRRGSEDVLAILFDMNLLWELFVYRTLKKGESKGGYKVSAQNQKKFWNSRRIRPDLVLNWEDGRCVVIDTKWKLIDDFRPADTDLKQMYAYNMYWQTRRSVLLYPGLQSEGGEWGQFHEGLPKASEPGNECKVVTCRIWEQSDGRVGLKANLADELLALFG